MKEKIKNFLLKIKNFLCCEFKTPVYKLMLFGIIMIFLSFICFSCSNFVNSAFNDNSNNVENVDTDFNIIDRDIKGANPPQSAYINPQDVYTTIHCNSNYNVYDVYNILVSREISSYSILPNTLTYPFYFYSNSDTNNYAMLCFNVVSSQITTFYFFELIVFDSNFNLIYENILAKTIYSTSGNVYQYLPLNANIDISIVPLTNLSFGNTIINVGAQNNLLYDVFSSLSFETSSSDIDTSSLTLNETNFDRSVYFSTFLTKETIAGYFSQLTYETTNFITPSLTLNGVDSYTIITGRIGSVPISNYIPSLVVVKYESKYVVYNYLRDNYLTPIYDTSTGVLDNVLGDGNYFLDVSSPTYFGSQNDKFNLFISAINIADSPLYSLISIGYNNGYDFGYGYGYNTGHQVGFADGEESGFNEGYDTGYENGFNEGRDTANALGPVMSLFKDTADVVASVLNVQILPNITIGTILLFPLVALLFALFVRLFFGG